MAEKPTNFADYHVIIIGAGISGINTAYRIQTELNLSYTILEARSDLGGTWDLFKYPGIRSDSDLYTFGFQFRPWQGATIASGPEILKYVKETASIYGIDKKIQFNQKVTAANWSSEQAIWSLNIASPEGPRTLRARFITFCTGYYDYEQPLATTIPGLSNFKGEVIHPQFWPKDYSVKDKRVVIIGSGATAITLLPALVSAGAAHVTMLQRSPSYVLSVRNPSPKKHDSSTVDEQRFSIFRPSTWIPQTFLIFLLRLRFILLPWLFYLFCQTFPGTARRLLLFLARQQLPDSIPLDPHFTPSYNPWDQRLCVSPNGDFFAALRSGHADIVTGTISTCTEDSIIVHPHPSTKTTPTTTTPDTKPIPLHPTTIITATGLALRLAGGIPLTLDDRHPLDPGSRVFWHHCMLDGLPNAAFVVGYTNASWTLGADVAAFRILNVLRHLVGRDHQDPSAPWTHTTVHPHLSPQDRATMRLRPTMRLSATYVRAAVAAGRMPRSGDRGPWRPRPPYVWDVVRAWLRLGPPWGEGEVDGLCFGKAAGGEGGR